MSKTATPAGSLETIPVLPLRDIVVFPHMIVPLFVGREKSIRALEEVMGADKQIILATQLNAADDDPEPDAIYDIGVLANVLQLLKLPDGTVKVLVEGSSRARIEAFTDRADFHEARAVVLPEPEEEAVEIEALARKARQLSGHIHTPRKGAIDSIDDERNRQPDERALHVSGDHGLHSKQRADRA